MRLGTIVMVALIVMPAAAAGPAGIPWSKVQGIQVDDFKDEFLKSVAVLLEKLPCYGRCTESIAACLRKDPAPTTAVRLARDVLNLAAASNGEEEIRKWVQIRARMAHTG
jgi:hypothetical protein